MNGRRIANFIKNHGATILSICAGLGVVATGVSAYHAGRNAKDKECSEDDTVPEQSWKDVVVPVSFGAATIGCIAGSRYLGRRTEKELLAACSALALYARRKDKTSNRKSEEEPNERTYTRRDIEDTGTGDVIFIEDFTGRRFKASWECYEYAKRKLQENFSVAQCVTLNEFYGLLNLSETSAGEVLGWTIDQMIMDPFYDGNNMLYEDALTQICIAEDTDEDGNVIIYYCVLPIGSLAGIGPCNY